MSPERQRMLSAFGLLVFVVALTDVMVFQTSLAGGYLLWVRFPWHGNWQYFSEFSRIMWVLPPLAIVVFKAIGLYRPEMGVMSVMEQSLIFKAIWILYALFFGATFFYREVEISRLATLYSMVLATFLISTERFFFRRIFSWLNEKGIANRKALVYGAGFHGVRLARWIRQTPQMGIQVLGYLDDDPERLLKRPETPPIVGGLKALTKWVQTRQVSILFISHRKLSEDKVIEIIQLCRQLQISCWVIPSLYQFHVEHVEMQHIGGIPLLAFREPFGRRYYEFFKHAIDKVLALLLLIVSSPLWLVVALGIGMTSGPPVFFKQRRVGKQGVIFTIYKFRTLKASQTKEAVSPELEKAVEKVTTPLGRFLRRSGLDEIPQLLNVLKGEMSLIGPRPEMPFLVQRYGPLERERLNVRPGITGLWQISEDRKRLLIHENMDYDLYYVEHMGFNLDLAIAVKTVTVILKRLWIR